MDYSEYRLRKIKETEAARNRKRKQRQIQKNKNIEEHEIKRRKNLEKWTAIYGFRNSSSNHVNLEEDSPAPQVSYFMKL